MRVKMLMGFISTASAPLLLLLLLLDPSRMVIVISADEPAAATAAASVESSASLLVRSSLRQPLFQRSLQQTTNTVSANCDWTPITIDGDDGDALYGDSRGMQMGAAVAFSRDGSTVATGSPGGLFTASTPGRVHVYHRNDKDVLVALGHPIEGQVVGDEAGGAVGTYKATAIMVLSKRQENSVSNTIILLLSLLL